MLLFKNFLLEVKQNDNPKVDGKGKILSYPEPEKNPLDRILVKKYKWKHYVVHALKNNTNYDHTTAIWDTLKGKYNWQKVAWHANEHYKDKYHEIGLKNYNNLK